MAEDMESEGPKTTAEGGGATRASISREIDPNPRSSALIRGRLLISLTPPPPPTAGNIKTSSIPLTQSARAAVPQRGHIRGARPSRRRLQSWRRASLLSGKEFVPNAPDAARPP